MKRIENKSLRSKPTGQRARRLSANVQLDMFDPANPSSAPIAQPSPELSKPFVKALEVPAAQSRIDLTNRLQETEKKQENIPDHQPNTSPAQRDSAASRDEALGVARRAQARALPARSLPALTRRQHDLLRYLEQRAQRGERPPSLTEICRDLGLVSRGSLHKQVVALIQAGLVEPMNGKQRGVRLIGPADANDDSALPLLGVIAAGQPIEALLRNETVVIPGWLRGAGGRYALRVRGDSMRDAGILDGDVIVVDPRPEARNGETVIALIDGEAATLKRIEQRPGEVLLHAENPAFPAQRYAPEQVQIQGVVVAALRRYA